MMLFNVPNLENVVVDQISDAVSPKILEII